MRGSVGRRQPCITWLFSANHLSRHQSLHLIRIWREIRCRTWKKGHEELCFCTYGPMSVINRRGRVCHLRVTEHRRDRRKSAPVGSSSTLIYSYTHSFDVWTICCRANAPDLQLEHQSAGSSVAFVQAARNTGIISKTCEIVV